MHTHIVVVFIIGMTWQLIRLWPLLAVIHQSSYNRKSDFVHEIIHFDGDALRQVDSKMHIPRTMDPAIKKTFFLLHGS